MIFSLKRGKSRFKDLCNNMCWYHYATIGHFQLAKSLNEYRTLQNIHIYVSFMSELPIKGAKIITVNMFTSWASLTYACTPINANYYKKHSLYLYYFYKYLLHSGPDTKNSQWNTSLIKYKLSGGATILLHFYETRCAAILHTRLSKKAEGLFKKHIYFKYTERKLILLFNVIPFDFNAPVPAMHRFFNSVRKKFFLAASVTSSAPRQWLLQRMKNFIGPNIWKPPQRYPLWFVFSRTILSTATVLGRWRPSWSLPTRKFYCAINNYHCNEPAFDE
jgi:hypothetical protein